MSASTQTRRLVTPSTAKVLTRAITASERALDVVQAHEPVLAVDQHADGVEAKLARAKGGRTAR